MIEWIGARAGPDTGRHTSHHGEHHRTDPATNEPVPRGI